METNKYLMQVAMLAKSQSKITGTHVGCVLAKNGRVVSIGVNGYTPGANDAYIDSLDRKDQLQFAIHAEENAILNAARQGTTLEGCEAFVTHYPCAGCMSKLRSAGITNIFYSPNKEFEKRWKNSHGSNALQAHEFVHDIDCCS